MIILTESIGYSTSCNQLTLMLASHVTSIIVSLAIISMLEDLKTLNFKADTCSHIDGMVAK